MAFGMEEASCRYVFARIMSIVVVKKKTGVI